MKPKSWMFIAVYFLVLLGGAKLLTFLSAGEALSFWPAFVGAALLSMVFCKSAHALWLAPTLYFLVFTIDFISGWQLITSARTESLTTGLFAAAIFVAPLLLGWGIRVLGRK